MNKKIICLFLSLMMLVSAFLVGCGGNGNVEVPSTPLTTRTLSMWVVCDQNVFDYDLLLLAEKYLANDASLEEHQKSSIKEWIKNWVPEGKDASEFVKEQKKISQQYDAVEKAINVITKKQFSIQLNIRYISEEIYYDYVESCIRIPNSGYTGVIEGSLAVKNELDVPEYVYPVIPDTQVDILFIGDEFYFNKFVDEELISALTLDKTILTEVYPSYISAVTVDGKVYGIPNNVVSGEYTYLLINKQLADKYSFLANDMTTWEACESFLNVIKDEVDVPILLPDYLSEEGYTFDEILSEFLINNHYWSISYEENDGNYNYSVDDGKFSILGSGYQMNATQNGLSTTKYLFDVTLSSTAHQSQMASLMYYMNNGYFKNADEDDTVGISLFTGDILDAQQYKDDYYLVTVDSPRLNKENAYEGMFAVSTSTTNLSKSIQIISYFLTNSEVRNLLQYGIEGENYVLDDDGLVVALENNLYEMDINVTGNVLNAYAENTDYATYDEEGNIKDVWGLAKLQASETLVDPLFGFNFNDALAHEDNSYPIDNAKLDELNAISEEYYQKILAIDKTLSIAEIRDVLRGYGRELATNATIIKMRNMTYSTTGTKEENDAEKNGTSPAEVYYEWLLRNGLTKEITAADK